MMSYADDGGSCTSNAADWVTSETECVLSSTLSGAVQTELVSAGHAVDYSCGLDALPGEVNAQCNEWACGCSRQKSSLEAGCTW